MHIAGRPSRIFNFRFSCDQQIPVTTETGGRHGSSAISGSRCERRTVWPAAQRMVDFSRRRLCNGFANTYYRAVRLAGRPFFIRGHYYACLRLRLGSSAWCWAQATVLSY
jgi:hypothetical protein